jgi:hypothetical protein
LTGAVVALGVTRVAMGVPLFRRRDLAELADPPHTKTRLKPIRSKPVAVHHPDPRFDTSGLSCLGRT